MNEYKLIIEDYACWGCKACEVACKQEHNSPLQGAYPPSGTADALKHLSVWEDGPRFLDKKLHFIYRVTVCRHCTEPLCAVACPEGAITRDPATGIVLLDPGRCNGCQALPGESGPEKQGISPCKLGCPARNDIQGMVSLTARGKYREALQLLKETSPFPSVCGRVCYHPCESGCNRKQIDDPVGIQSIERFLADQDAQAGRPYLPESRPPRAEKVAVIGSGPAGLSAAYFLARDGYPVTVYERLPVAGGMMRVGIPEYRLPRDVLSREIALIEQLGVQIRTGVEVGRDVTVAGLREQGVRAFFLAIGAHECKRLGLEGEDLQGVHPGVEFLRDVNLGKKKNLGERVAVVGGGNVAMDSVRTALRTGSGKAFVLYRRGPEDMPADPEEIRECEKEGIAIYPWTQPKRIIGENGRVKAIECLRMEPGVPEQDGRRSPVPVEGSEFLIEVDAVIPAIGQESDWACLGPECACTLSEWGTLNVDPETLQTDDPDIFAGGDAVTGPRTVVEAVAAGRRAAVSMDLFLRGISLHADRAETPNPILKPRVAEWSDSPRVRRPLADPGGRVKGFGEVRLGLGEQAAGREAGRCLSCGSCCIQACPYGAISFDATTAKARKCDLCHHRVTNGLFPACADNICLAHCIYFGDPADIEGRILEKRKKRGGWGEVVPKAISFGNR